jgi:hypothetical protein
MKAYMHFFMHIEHNSCVAVKRVSVYSCREKTCLCSNTFFPIDLVPKELKGKKQTTIITFTNLFLYLFTDN